MSTLIENNKIRLRVEENFRIYKEVNEHRKTHSRKETAEVFNLSEAKVTKYCQKYDYLMKPEDPEMMIFLKYYDTLYHKLRRTGYADKNSVIKVVTKNICRLLDISDIGIGKIAFLLQCVYDEGININREELLGTVSNFEKVRVGDRLSSEDISTLKNDPFYIKTFSNKNQICRALEINPISFLGVDSKFMSNDVCGYISDAIGKIIYYDIDIDKYDKGEVIFDYRIYTEVERKRGLRETINSYITVYGEVNIGEIVRFLNDYGIEKTIEKYDLTKREISIIQFINKSILLRRGQSM